MTASMRRLVYAAIEPLIRPAATFSPRRREKGTGGLRRILHGVGDQVVDGSPGIAGVGRECVAEAVLESPHERLAKSGVVLFVDAVRDVAAAERANARDDAIG